MTLTSERTSPTTVVFRRRFRTAPARIWEAHFSEDLLPRWLTGPDGWTMPNCKVDARDGGSFRYDFSHPEQGEFAIFGTYETLEPPHRSVHVEQMDLPDGKTPPARYETRFDPDGDGTLMTMTMTTESAEDLEQALATGMVEGMTEVYTRLDSFA